MGKIRKIKGFVISRFYETKNAIIDFQENPFANLSIIITTLAMTSLVLLAIISWILFIAHGGYKEQFALIKDLHLIKALSATAATSYFSNITIIINSILFVISILVITVEYIIKATGVKRNIMIVLQALIILLGIIPLLISLFAGGEFFNNFFYTYMQRYAFAIVITWAVLVFGSLITSIILLCKSEVMPIFKSLLKSMLLAYIVLPLLLLGIENFIPFLIIIAISAIVLGIMYFSRLGEGSSSGGSSGGSSSYNSPSPAKSNRKEKNNKEAQYINDVSEYLKDLRHRENIQNDLVPILSQSGAKEFAEYKKKHKKDLGL